MVPSLKERKPETRFASLPERPTGCPLVMGIVNVTPDSFSDGGTYFEHDAAIGHGMEMAEAGADILDVGGESTRPGSEPVAVQEEMDRVLPVVEGLVKETGLPISIDTMKPQVAREAVKLGAAMWNDVSALSFTDQSPDMAAQLGVPVILMHMLGKPKTMQRAPVYDSVVDDVIAWLRKRAHIAVAAGVPRSAIAVDPGIGFGKTLEHNLSLLGNLDRIQLETGYPLLLGASRKRFVGKLDHGARESERLGGSLAAVAAGAWQRAWAVRVHDVRETVQFLKIHAAIARASARA